MGLAGAERAGEARAEGAFDAAEASRAIAVGLTRDVTEMRRTAAAGGTLTGCARSELAPPLRSQAAALPGWAGGWLGAACLERLAFRAATEARRHHARALTAEVPVVCTRGFVGRVFRGQLEIVEGFGVARHAQSKVFRRGREGERGDADLAIADLAA